VGCPQRYLSTEKTSGRASNAKLLLGLEVEFWHYAVLRPIGCLLHLLCGDRWAVAFRAFSKDDGNSCCPVDWKPASK